MDEFTNKTGLAYFWNRIKSVFASQTALNTGLSNKVDKEPGKGLSTNDYTTVEKNKLAGIEDGAEVNDIGIIQVNGVNQPIVSKTVNIHVPTNTNQLTNGSNYQSESQVVNMINNAISGIVGVEFVKVEYLPPTGEAGKIYLVLEDSTTGDVYNEYAWVDNQWEKLGSMNLEGFWNDENLIPITTEEIDLITV